MDASSPQTRVDGRVDDQPDPQLLVEIARTRMPFGRYEGRLLIDLPEPYVVWFANRGFPAGRLGLQLATLYEIKRNGLEKLIAPLRAEPRARGRARASARSREDDRG